MGHGADADKAGSKVLVSGIKGEEDSWGLLPEEVSRCRFLRRWAESVRCLIIRNIQLASEEMVAKREGYDIEIVKADMTKTFPFADETFDLIFHPVSNCYVEEVLPYGKNVIVC